MRHHAAILLAVLLLAGALSPTACSKIIYVKPDSPGPTLDGTSWAYAFHEVADAVSASISGDEIWVARGTYAVSVWVSTAVSMYGGFAGTETDKTQRNWRQNVSLMHNSDFYLPSGLGATVRIDGFTILCTDTSLDKGITFSNLGASAVICNNVIQGCYTGIEASSTGSCATVFGNVIRGCMTAVTAYGSSKIINNTIVGCASTTESAVTCYGGSPVISGNIIAFNGKGIGVSGGTPVVRNNCVCGNRLADYTGISPGAGDISADPMLVSARYGQVHLLPGSPCIDSGNNADVQDILDMDCQARTGNGTVDIGADEYYSDDPQVDTHAIVHVSPDGSDMNDGSAWSLAKRTMQAAIDLASKTGGEIWARAGLYPERITVPAYVYLYGGFAGNETQCAQRNWSANRSILDGQFQGYTVTFATGGDVFAIDGFTITRGTNGVYCSGYSPGVYNNVLTNNTGPAIYTDRSWVRIVNNVITGNGGGGGPAVRVSGPLPVVLNNTIVGNDYGTTSVLWALEDGGVPTVCNNIIAFNSRTLAASIGYPAPNIRENCTFGNPGDDPASFPNNVWLDPKLVSTTYGNIHLQPDSPCMNAGDNSYNSLLGEFDIDHQPRIRDGVVDIGAVECDGSSWPQDYHATVRVSPDGDDALDGSTWALAKRTVQAAVNAAAAIGGEVWVKAGVYPACTTIPPYVYLYGGFLGTENYRSQRDWLLNASILDGGQSGPVISMPAGSKSVLDGFTVRNGSYTGGGGGVRAVGFKGVICNNIVTGNSSDRGGGIYLGSGATLTANMVSGNAASSQGGGIYFSGGYGPVFSLNRVESNNAPYGGGVYSSRSLTMTGNRIVGNSASLDGGGMWGSGDYANGLVNNLVAGNSAGGYGGGIYGLFSGSSNTIVDNTAGDGGGACLNRAYSSLEFANNIIAFCSSGITISGGNGTYLPTLRNNCVYSNAGRDYNGITPGTGDISVDPRFLNRATGDYHLSTLSAVINKGYDSAAYLPATDMDGESRIYAGHVDIGADEVCFSKASISEGKKSGDNMPVVLSGQAVTAAFANEFYIENANRSMGILVKQIGHALTSGMKADIQGVMRTTTGGERYIDAASAVQAGMGSMETLLMSNGRLGGGSWEYDAVTGAGQKGLREYRMIKNDLGQYVRTEVPVLGMNNIGLLVTTSGKVTYATTAYFYVDDGSGVSDSSGKLGVRIYSPGLIAPALNKHVVVTGISHMFGTGTSVYRQIRARTQADIRVLN